MSIPIIDSEVNTGLQPETDIVSSVWARSGGDPVRFAELLHAEIEDPQSLTDLLARALEFTPLLKAAAGLPRARYDVFRKVFTRDTPIRLSTIDDAVATVRAAANKKDTSIVSDVLPWGEPVDGGELFDSVLRYLKRYIVFSSEADAIAVAAWAMYAHHHDCFDESAFLCFYSPKMRCGKSRALAVIASLTPRALSVSGMTTAVLFRVIEKYNPTLIIDEADDIFKGPENELRCILNSGHSRSGAKVPRCVGDDHDVTIFSTYGPKVTALIGALPSTLRDRSILILMERKTTAQTVDRFRPSKADPRPGRMLARWAQDNKEAIGAAPDPDLPSGLDDRQSDCWRPLVSIADHIGRGEAVRGACAAIALGREAEEDDISGMLLEDIRAIIGSAESISSAGLLSGLVALEEHPWSTYNYKNGKPLSMRQLASKLRPFGIKSKNIRGAAGQSKGYERSDFQDAWSRYLSPSGTPNAGPLSSDLPDTPPFIRPRVTSPESLDNSEILSVPENDLGRQGNDEKVNDINNVTHGTDEKPKYQGREEADGKKRVVELATAPILTPEELEKLRAASRAEARKFALEGGAP